MRCVKPSRDWHWVAGKDTGSRCLCSVCPGKVLRPGGWSSRGSPPLGFTLHLGGNLGGKDVCLSLAKCWLFWATFYSPGNDSHIPEGDHLPIHPLVEAFPGMLL